MKKRLAILGSTGSIGVNALRVVSAMKKDFEVVALSADTNTKLLSRQIKTFKPRIVCVGRGELCRKVRGVPGHKIGCVYGQDGLKEIVSRKDIDIILFAISGTACLVPLVEAIKNKKTIALANKEALVSAGSIVMGLARRNNVRIIPVDSEHSAIFQCLDGRRDALSKIYLTGSGGPLLNVDRSKFSTLSREFVLRHPKWNMGKKISVDSATMMNKGLEVIEAQHLFNMPHDLIEVLIHPEAIVHSMVEFADGAILAQLGVPDMRIPIQFALTYPERKSAKFGRVMFSETPNLTFRKPDLQKFPCLGLARRAASEGGTTPAVLCASDEEAVKMFLAGRISFLDIPKVVEMVLSRHHNVASGDYSISDVLDKEEWAREEAKSICSR